MLPRQRELDYVCKFNLYISSLFSDLEFLRIWWRHHLTLWQSGINPYRIGTIIDFRAKQSKKNLRSCTGLRSAVVLLASTFILSLCNTRKECVTCKRLPGKMMGLRGSSGRKSVNIAVFVFFYRKMVFMCWSIKSQNRRRLAQRATPR